LIEISHVAHIIHVNAVSMDADMEGCEILYDSLKEKSKDRELRV